MKWYKKEVQWLANDFSSYSYDYSIHFVKMLPVYDAKNKLWQAAEKQLLENSKVSAGQQMLDSLLKHGSNVAVVRIIFANALSKNRITMNRLLLD